MTWPEVTGIISVAFLLFGTWLNVRNSRDGKWSELLERHEAWQATQKARIDELVEQTGRQGKKIGCLENKVRQLEAENRTVETKYGISIGHIRTWRLHHPESVPLITVPPEILDDL